MSNQSIQGDLLFRPCRLPTTVRGPRVAWSVSPPGSLFGLPWYIPIKTKRDDELRFVIFTLRLVRLRYALYSGLCVPRLGEIDVGEVTERPSHRFHVGAAGSVIVALSFTGGGLVGEVD